MSPHGVCFLSTFELGSRFPSRVMLRFYFLLFGAENWTTLILTLCSPLWQRFNPNLEIDNFFASSLCCNTSTFLPRSDTARMLTNCPLPWGDSIMCMKRGTADINIISHTYDRVTFGALLSELIWHQNIHLVYNSTLHCTVFHFICLAVSPLWNIFSRVMIP